MMLEKKNFKIKKFQKTHFHAFLFGNGLNRFRLKFGRTQIIIWDPIFVLSKQAPRNCRHSNTVSFII